MAGTYMIDSQATFQAAILMATGPRVKYGSNGEQDITMNGERKWSAEVAVTFAAEAGRAPVSEVISVLLVGQDPGQVVQPGTPVAFDGLRVGVSSPEKRDNGRVSGGKAWFSASAIRPAHGRKSEAA